MIFGKQFRKIFYEKGYTVVRHTERADLEGFVRRLRPQNCGKQLIRIGCDDDGGYLIPDDLDGIEYCFSPGVNTISAFENQLADRGIRSFLADYSVDGPPITRPEFVFDKKFLGFGESEQYFTLSTWKDKYLRGYDGDMLLQMDIEGAEYEVLANAPDSLLAQFRIIVIEFHYLDRLLDPYTFKYFDSIFRKLAKSFHVVHVHPNNYAETVHARGLDIPRSLEVTYYNRKRALEVTDASPTPHLLDRENDPLGKPLRLSKFWSAD